MKKLLTIMLSMVLVLSSCLMISADDETIIAKQDTNGDLVITAYSDEAKKVIQDVYDGWGEKLVMVKLQ